MNGANGGWSISCGHRIPNPKTPDTTDYDTPVRTLTIGIASVAVAVLIIGVLLVRWLVVRHRRPRAGHSTGQLTSRRGRK